MTPDTMFTTADLINTVVSFGSLILICFVFYTLLQVARVVREELKDKHEQRFDRWYNERIVHPKHPIKPKE